MFLALPTPYSESIKTYDKTELNEIIMYLADKSYKGVIVVKSTVEPGTTRMFTKIYPALSMVHNPEFLTARRAKCISIFRKTHSSER